MNPPKDTDYKLRGENDAPIGYKYDDGVKLLLERHSYIREVSDEDWDGEPRKAHVIEPPKNGETD